MRGFIFALLVCLVYAKTKTTLVLGGGGAKGVFQLGVLEELCKTDLAGSWSTIVGTSIGALNGAILAQFPPHEHCTKGLDTLRQYWNSIENHESLFISTQGFHGKCLTVLGAGFMISSWLSRGGFCDPSPAIQHFHANVHQELIANSTTKLFVPASNLDSIVDAEWFDHTSPDIVDGAIASGTLSPLIPPTKIGNKFYVDGGVFHNVPILKALEEGATRVIAIVLTPTNASEAFTIPDLSKETRPGPAVFHYYMDAIQRQLLLNHEIRDACILFPDAEILGVVPATKIGSVLDFTREQIVGMRLHGQKTFAESGLVDLCEMAQRVRKVKFAQASQTEVMTTTSAEQGGVHVHKTVAVAVCVVCAAIGAAVAVAAIAVLNRRKQYQFQQNYLEPLTGN